MTRSGRVRDAGAVGGGRPLVEYPVPDDAAREGESWTVYLLRCRDGSLYAGITTDMDRRLTQHQTGTASRYTRSRRPVAVVYRESYATRSDASKREAAVKTLSREAKERLIDGARGGIVGPAPARVSKEG